MQGYKGYRGSTEYSAEDGVFHGKLLGIGALVTYESETEKGLQHERSSMISVYREVREIFSDMGRYTVTVLFGGSWAEIIKTHPDYADGEPEKRLTQTF